MWMNLRNVTLTGRGQIQNTTHCSYTKLLSRVRLFATLWTVAFQAPLSIGFSRQEYGSGLPCPPPGDLPHSGIKPGCPALQADSSPLIHQGSLLARIRYLNPPEVFIHLVGVLHIFYYKDCCFSILQKKKLRLGW